MISHVHKDAISLRSFTLLSILMVLLLIAVGIQPTSAEDAAKIPIALAFGRCDLQQSECPKNASDIAAVGPEDQSTLRNCFASKLDRSVAVWSNAAIPTGLWINVSLVNARDQSDHVVATLVLRRGSTEVLDGFVFLMMPPGPEAYLAMCDQFSGQIRGRIE